MASVDDAEQEGGVYFCDPMLNLEDQEKPSTSARIKNRRNVKIFPDPRDKIHDPELKQNVNKFLESIGTDPNTIDFTERDILTCAGRTCHCRIFYEPKVGSCVSSYEEEQVENFEDVDSKEICNESQPNANSLSILEEHVPPISADESNMQIVLTNEENHPSRLNETTEIVMKQGVSTVGTDEIAMKQCISTVGTDDIVKKQGVSVDPYLKDQLCQIN